MVIKRCGKENGEKMQHGLSAFSLILNTICPVLLTTEISIRDTFIDTPRNAFVLTDSKI